MSKTRKSKPQADTVTVMGILRRSFHSTAVSGILIGSANTSPSVFTTDLMEFGRGLQVLIEHHFQYDPEVSGINFEAVEWTLVARMIVEDDIRIMDGMLVDIAM